VVIHRMTNTRTSVLHLEEANGQIHGRAGA
jgi:hypothetical protein